MKNIIGSILKEHRTSDEINITLNELAKSTGLSQPFLSVVENGKKIPTIETLFKIIEKLAKAGTKVDESDSFFSTIYFTQSIVNDLVDSMGVIDRSGEPHPDRNLDENEIKIFNILADYSKNLDSSTPYTPSKFLTDSLKQENDAKIPTNLNKFIEILSYDLDLNFLIENNKKNKLNLLLDEQPISDEELKFIRNTLSGIRYQRNKK